MGHSRLGTLPRTRAWADVVGFIASGTDVAQVAQKTLEAAQKALATTKGDIGFREAMVLLSQLAIAGGAADAVGYLKDLGVAIQDGFSVADVVTSLSDALDRQMDGHGRRTDWGEIARHSLTAAVSQMLNTGTGSLFEATREDVATALRPLRREKEFGALASDVFGRIAVKTLHYFLSKTLATHVGKGQRFATLKEYSQFKDAMSEHCKQASKIVEKFAGQWLQKQLRDNGGQVSRRAAEGFGAHAIKKLQLELQARVKRHGK